MPRSRSFPLLLRLRPYFLLAFLAVVVTVIGLYLFGRAGRGGLMSRDQVAVSEVPVDQGIITLGEGFEFTSDEEGRTVFKLRSERMSADREETVYLEEVALTVFDVEGRPFELEARNAEFNRKSEEAVLVGEVRLRSGDGFELRTSRLELKNGGRVLVSDGEVDFSYGDNVRGRANRLRIIVPDQVYLLQGKVAVTASRPGHPDLRLRSERLFLDRQDQLLRADGKVEIEQGGDRLKARRINAFLSSDLRAIRFLRARWEVEGSREAGPPAAPTTDNAEGAESVKINGFQFSGRSLTALIDPTGGGVQNIELEGSPRDPATLRARSSKDSVQTLAAGYITARLAGDNLRDLEAFGAPRLLEVSAADSSQVIRRLTGNRLRATIATEGVLNSILVSGDVEFVEGDLSARGDRATFDIAAGRGELFGEEVVIESPRGRVVSPHADFDNGEGIVHADGGVRARLDENGRGRETGPLAGSPLGHGDGPVLVESEEAFFREEPQGFLFRGGVRAWRGKNVLLAEALRGDEAKEKLIANGGVRTVWLPDRDPEAAPTSTSGPMEVQARELTYRRQERLLVYSGEVRFSEDGRKLTCDRLEVILGEDGGAEQVEGSGHVGLNDPASGRQVEAARVLYFPRERTLEFTGKPAVVRGGATGTVQAPLLVYDLELNRVRASSGGPAP